jgi:hypothetical protein
VDGLVGEILCLNVGVKNVSATADAWIVNVVVIN